jgi:hypothetical protein
MHQPALDRGAAPRAPGLRQPMPACHRRHPLMPIYVMLLQPEVDSERHDEPEATVTVPNCISVT